MKLYTQLPRIFLVAIIFFVACSKGSDTVPTPPPSGPTPPAASAGVSTTNLLSDGFNISWSAVAGVDGYNLYVSTDAGFTMPVAGYNPRSTTATTEKMLGLNPLTHYFIKVESVKSGLKSSAVNTSVTTEDKSVYVWGWEEQAGAQSMAKYWKNGIEVALTVPSGVTTQATAMCISGNDIYVAGMRQVGYSDYAPMYWKNGVPVLQLGSSSIGGTSGICVNGDDVYVSGFDLFFYAYLGCYWKNGSIVPIGTSGHAAAVRAMTVVGNDVYLCGLTAGPTGSNCATYWKNGVATEVVNTFPSDASSISVYNGDVYMSGYIDNGSKRIITYWKNGTEVPVSNPSVNGYPGGIFVSGGDVYVTGMESATSTTQAKYWKNGTPYNLLNGSNDTPVGIFVSGSDVYVAGTEIVTPYRRAKYWKNGNAVYLGNGSSNSYANGILVK